MRACLREGWCGLLKDWSGAGGKQVEDISMAIMFGAPSGEGQMGEEMSSRMSEFWQTSAIKSVQDSHLVTRTMPHN